MKFFASLFLLFGLTAMVLSIDRSFDQADLFLDAALAPSWTDYLSTQKVGYFQDFENLAHIRGTVQTTSALPSVIFRLPEGVAPSRNLIFAVVTFSQSSPYALSVGEVQINKKGEVIATEGKTVFSLDGLSFEVPQKKVVKRSSVSRANFVIPRSYPFSSLFPHPPGNLGPAVSFSPSITSLYQDECPSFKPFWQMYWNATSYAEAASFYCAEPNPANPDDTDNVERVRLRGHFTLLDTTGYNQIAHLPPARQPNKPIRMCTVTPFGAIRVDVTSGGAIIPKGYKSTQVSLDGLEYLVDQENFWDPITNWQNGFRAPTKNYFREPFLPSEPFTQPGFKLDSQGKVHLKGIVSVPKPMPKGQIFTLPEGYRPVETIYRCAATRRGAVTLSISPLGWVSIVDVFGSVNVEWLSLDGIHFHPERVVPFPSTNAKVYLESNFFNFEVTAEDNQNTVLIDFHEPEEHINFPTQPVTVVGAVNEKLVRATLSLDSVSKKGKVEFFDFVKPTVPVGADWFPLVIPKQNQVDIRGRARVEYAATLPAWQFDRNKNLILFRGLLFLSENPVLFSLPEWIHVDRDFYFLVEANSATYPIVVHTNGEVTYDGSVTRAQGVTIDLTGIHFSASVGQPPAASSAKL